MRAFPTGQPGCTSFPEGTREGRGRLRGAFGEALLRSAVRVTRMDGLWMGTLSLSAGLERSLGPRSSMPDPLVKK